VNWLKEVDEWLPSGLKPGALTTMLPLAILILGFYIIVFVCNFGVRPPPLTSKSSKALGMITDAPWYVPNAVLRRDLNISVVKEEIQCLSSQYGAPFYSHPNLLTANLKKQPTNRRLQHILSTDLPTRFLV
jgi:hypothetical protein